MRHSVGWDEVMLSEDQLCGMCAILDRRQLHHETHFLFTRQVSFVEILRWIFTRVVCLRRTFSLNSLSLAARSSICDYRFKSYSKPSICSRLIILIPYLVPCPPLASVLFLTSHLVWYIVRHVTYEKKLKKTRKRDKKSYITILYRHCVFLCILFSLFFHRVLLLLLLLSYYYYYYYYYDYYHYRCCYC